MEPSNLSSWKVQHTITADDKLYLNTTRIDVRGNRLSVTLPIDNWTCSTDN